MSSGETLASLDYSVLQQCMHCGMCLPTCPTYDATKNEQHSPRGRISLMRAIADGQLTPARAFGEEMSYCLGCLACETACPAGVDYAHLFEIARADGERTGALNNPIRQIVRGFTLNFLFTHPRCLRLVGRAFWLFQICGLQRLARALGLTKLLPKRLRELEPMTPIILTKFSHQLIQPLENSHEKRRFRVGLLTGCIQDLVFADINRDTADVLLANGCEVVTPPVQPCCGSLHAHNGDPETAGEMARRMINLFDPASFDAIITNAAGCGSHLKNYGRLLEGDPGYAGRAREWDRKVRDIHEWLVEIGFRAPKGEIRERVTYHEACHLCHGQRISRQPREILRSIPGIELVELPESTWCCGSAGVYNLTQPETATALQKRKVGHILSTRAGTVATSNPGCHLQISQGLGQVQAAMRVDQPVSLLARAYRKEKV
ncbi:MAG: (Fe-S)-binding protein [Verrucomicrobia bacterium]|nr:(Fe-S)-binding protein [Verrucomicrobiota bacterium]